MSDTESMSDTSGMSDASQDSERCACVAVYQRSSSKHGLSRTSTDVSIACVALLYLYFSSRVSCTPMQHTFVSATRTHSHAYLMSCGECGIKQVLKYCVSMVLASIRVNIIPMHKAGGNERPRREDFMTFAATCVFPLKFHVCSCTTSHVRVYDEHVQTRVSYPRMANAILRIPGLWIRDKILSMRREGGNERLSEGGSYGMRCYLCARAEILCRVTSLILIQSWSTVQDWSHNSLLFQYFLCVHIIHQESATSRFPWFEHNL